MAYDILRRREVAGDWTMGAPVFTTSEDAKGKWDSLLSSTNNLNEDVSRWFAKNRGDEEASSFARQWSTWRDTVYSEYKDNARRKIIPDLAWGVWNRGDAKLKELDEWRGRFEKLSGRQVTAPSSKAEESHEPKKPGTSMWVFVAAGLAGAVALTFVQRKVG